MKSIFLFICIALTVSACQNPPAEETVEISSINKQALADSVKQEFLHAWNGYKTHAWGYDALQASFQNWS
jgi:ER degradation enhancer, mannosidase alpha-like 2